jgi:hypothetical protein
VGPEICEPIVDLPAWQGSAQCVQPSSLPQDSYCDLEGDGNLACASGICSVIDIMGLAEIGSCGQCNDDSDCGAGVCVAGEFILDTGSLIGTTCQQ